MTTIPQVLFEQAERRPHALAIQDGEWRLSYGELAEHVQKTAAVMRGVGLSHGNRFGIWAPNCAEWIVTALAGQSLGAVMVTLNTRYKGAEAADILRRSHCKLLFTIKGFLGYDYPAMLKGKDLPDLQEVIVIREELLTLSYLALVMTSVITTSLMTISPTSFSLPARQALLKGR